MMMPFGRSEELTPQGSRTGPAHRVDPAATTLHTRRYERHQRRIVQLATLPACAARLTAARWIGETPAVAGVGVTGCSGRSDSVATASRR